MAYPALPDFTVAGPDAFDLPAWWTYTRDDGTVNVCASTGAAVVRRARSALGLPAVPVWDGELQAALAARAGVLDASQPGAGWGALRAALAGQTAVDPTALRLALWLGYYAPQGLRLDAVGLAPGAALPAWGARLPEGPGGDTFVCWDPSRDPDPAAEPDFAGAVAASAAGLRLHPGESLPTSSVAPLAGPGGLSGGALLALAGAAVVAVVLAAWGSRPAAPPPSRRARR